MKKLWRKICLSALILSLVVTCFVGCGDEGTDVSGSGTADQQYVLRMGNTSAYPSQPNVFMREFKEKIEAATDQIKVELYEASTFGGPNEMIQGLQNGAMQCVCIPSGFYATIAPKSALLDLPYLFADPDEYFAVMNQETPEVDKYFAAQGLIVGGWIYESNRDILSIKPIQSIGDLNGKNIRTYSSSISQEELKALKVNPVIMGTGDVPMALQQGTIDGIQCGNTLMAPAKYYDQAKYLLTDCGTAVPIPCVFSKTFIDGMPEDLQSLVLDTAYKLITTTSYEYSHQYVLDCYQEMEDGGTTVTKCPQDMLGQMKAATEGVTTDFLEQNPDIQSAYDEIQGLIQDYRSKK